MTRNIIVTHYNLFFALCVCIGFVVPGLECLPKVTALILISVALFFSCSGVSVDELKGIKPRSVMLFYVLRFVLLPIIILQIAQFFVPEYALAIFLVSLAPIGGASTTLARLSGANTSVVLSATVITNMLVPIIIPVMIFYFGGAHIKINVFELFVTLFLSVLMPAAFYFLYVRKIKILKEFVRKEASFASTFALGCMLAIVISFQKDFILGDLRALFNIIAIGLCLFSVLYGVGWVFAWRDPVKLKKTYMIGSGVNNTGLCAGIAVLYFPSDAVLFTVAVEIPFIMMLMLLKVYTDRAHD
ncbi:MAG: bile acid:sodium symporter family protein [Alphaproteobacteria bacterium]